jgi:hypothetical protein
MVDDSGRGVSRREVLTAGAATGGTALLAGCTEGFASSGDGGDGGSGDDYTVSMAPTGEVAFDKPPESVAHYFPGYADMAVAVGHADTINSVGVVGYRDPIIHLFQLETAAQGVYPDEFGGEQLFDRQRVADIVNGEF